MGKLIYAMMVSLDGFIAGPDGELDWHVIDDYRLYVNPVVAGRGKPMFLGVDSVTNLRLVETRPFTSGVILLRYEVVNDVESDLPTNIGKPAGQALAVAGYNRLEQLAQVSEKEILKLHGVGPKAVGLLRQALAAKGLSFTK
jgi:hypothetical protein